MRITICCSVQEDVDNGPYRTYGLQMGAVRIDDISTHKCTVMRLQQRLERNHISPLHLVDAVEDFLAAYLYI